MNLTTTRANPRVLTVEGRKTCRIQAVVLRLLDCSSERYFSKRRDDRSVFARQLVVQLSREVGVSYPQIACAMQRNGHSTTITQYRAITARLRDTPTAPVNGYEGGALAGKTVLEILAACRKAIVAANKSAVKE